MTPILAACYFLEKKEYDGKYDRLANVLAYTAARHCRRWQLRIEQIQPDLVSPATGNPSHAWNHAKLEWWARVVETAPDGAEVLLIDADTFILRPLDPIWDLPFDLAYTARERSRLPLNGGVVAVRVSAKTRTLMRQWAQVDEGMLRGENAQTIGARVGLDLSVGPSGRVSNPHAAVSFHGAWHAKYAGMNQASFGCLLERGFDVDVRGVPCREWNCCEWETFSPETRIVHVKSRLRRAVFGSSPPALVPLVMRWHALEAEMRAAMKRRTA